MKYGLKVFFGILAILAGMRALSAILLFADRSSDIDVLIAFFCLGALVATEALIFWLLLPKKESK